MPPSGRVPLRRNGRSWSVDFFEDSKWQAAHSLSVELVAYYRNVLTVHANDPPTGKCRVCGLPTCQDWRSAYDQLAAGGEAMAQPDVWRTEAQSGKAWR
jgi:hypothetical protein